MKYIYLYINILTFYFMQNRHIIIIILYSKLY